MRRRIKLGTKLAVVGALAVGAIGASTYAGTTALGRSGNDSPDVQRSIQYERLIADVLPTPQYLVEPYLAEYRALREARPAQRTELTDRIRLDRATYYEKHAQWVRDLNADPVLSRETALRDAFLVDSFVPAETFWQLTVDEFLPALEGGRTAQAAAVLDGPITEAFTAHRAAIDNVVTLAQSRRDAHLDVVADDARGEQLRLAAIGGIGALVLVLVGLLLARSIRRPVRKLADAIEAAREELPRTVTAIELARADTPLPEIVPLGVDRDDELGQIAHAFETVRTAAIDLATRQATTRRSIGELFVNLGRRNQALINRQLSFIDQLEKTEEDPATLEGLFRLDHLATRMRRNAESLLVLAGAEKSRRWTESIEVGNVVRSALSEIEEYTQVDLGELEPVLVRGGVVADLAHLLAELLENSTAFSPPSTRVVVSGRMLTEGYVLSVIDEGIGMDAGAMADANRRIESVARRDAPSTRVLGLHVVGCLAARHSIRVRLVPSTGQGVTARVLLPPSTIEPTRGPQSPIQAVASATPLAYEHALSRLEENPVPAAEPAAWATGAGPDDVEPLPTRVRGANGAPAPEVFDPWEPEPTPDLDPTIASWQLEPDERVVPTWPSGITPPAAWGDPGATASDEAADRVPDHFGDPFAAGYDATDAGADTDPAFADDLSSAIRATFGDEPFAAADDVWPPTGAHDAVGAPELPPLPDALVAEPPMPWRPPAPPEPATFTSWRPEDADVPAAHEAASGASTDPDPGDLRRRVRGAQLPETGPARRPDDDEPRRSAEQVRSQLSRFRAGVDRGRREESGQPNPADEGDRS